MFPAATDNHYPVTQSQLRDVLAVQDEKHREHEANYGQLQGAVGAKKHAWKCEFVDIAFPAQVLIKMSLAKTGEPGLLPFHFAESISRVIVDMLIVPKRKKEVRNIVSGDVRQQSRTE